MALDSQDGSLAPADAWGKPTDPFAVEVVGHELHLHGELDLATVPILETALRRTLLTRREMIIVDCSALTFIDASGLSSLIGARRTAERSGAQLVLRAPSPALARLLRLTGMTSLFSTVGRDRSTGLPPSGGGGGS